MENCFLVIDASKHAIFLEHFKNQTDIIATEFDARSTTRNLFLSLLNLADTKKKVFMLKVKKKTLKNLTTFCEQNLNKQQSGLLIQFEKEQGKMKEKTTPKSPQNDKLIVVILPNGFAELVLDASKGFELSGATILNGIGVGQNNSSFLGMEINSDREVVMIALNGEIEKNFTKTLKQKFDENGNVNGVIFSLPLSNFIKFDKKQ